ncbi:MAG TPA: glycosyl hydrolase [Streptosporangiaceae bacterium]|nr:glycosyl hydrolase [Streptosporangiaceae bacterium]HEX2822475.1 glycosyl hydrolase [Streptosporangiaceae bacterium]
MKLIRIVIIGVAIVVAAAVTITAGIHDKSMAAPPPVKKVQVTLPTAPASYLGVYTAPSPHSYAGVTAFTSLIGVQPDVNMYYSGWLEPFQASFATSAASHGAVPLVQIDPTGVKLTAIASGKYDEYLISFADAVRFYGRPVILGFGHEMNGTWYTWANGHASPAAFIAAWRHIVNLFREAGAGNVTWLWTINIIEKPAGILSPVSWWPGSSYVTWVGIDGYYTKSSLTFAPLFGPTIVKVRGLTSDPILVAETAAGSAAGQPAKIADLFAGIRTYGLLGFVWFDAIGAQDWRLSSPAAVAAFRQGAAAYHRAGQGGG